MQLSLYRLLHLSPLVRGVVAAVPYPGPDWDTILFADDFSGPAGSAPSSANWIIQTGTSYPGGPPQWGTGEVETYTQSPQNVQLDGRGNLVITPKKLDDGRWTSARLETIDSTFAAPEGGMMRIEASLQLPNVSAVDGVGYWPAFWALGEAIRSDPMSWPSIGEFDILENVNGGPLASHGFHCGTDPSGPCNEPDGITTTTLCSGDDCHGSFHTYALLHDRRNETEAIYFAIDGEVQMCVTQDQVGDAVWAEAVDHGFFLILNVAVGGSYPNAVYGSQTPIAATVDGQSMKVDYVAVWSASAQIESYT